MTEQPNDLNELLKNVGLEGVDIVTEYELIRKKESNLTASQRHKVVQIYNATIDKMKKLGIQPGGKRVV